MNLLHRTVLALLLPSLGVGLPNPATAQFVEPDVEVIRLLSGEQVGDYFGWVADNVGDIDGDGIDESLVPAIAYEGFSGRITLYSGATGNILNDVVGTPGSAFGYAVGAAGDVDGNGIPDYIAGGGQVLVFSGADHQVLHDFSATTGFADGVHGAGDLNGDGFDDVVVGTQGAANTAPNAGRVWTFSGADGSVLWTRDGAAEGDFLGSAVGAVGDVNRDGTPDVVVGSSGAGAFDGGEALVLSGADGSLIHVLRPFVEEDARVFGSFFASGTPDMDGDRVGDIFVGDLDATVNGEASTGAAYIFSGRTGFPIHVLPGLQAGEGFGLGRGIPDVNGDRRADILVGAFNNSRGGPMAGAVYLFSGRSGALLRTITATESSDNFGGDAIGVGDVNSDGLPDFLATAPGRSFIGEAAGRSFVVSGTVLPCPADLDGNGRVGLFDLLRLSRSFGDADSPADLNGDGVVDVNDLLVLFRDRGRCARGFPR